MKLSVAALVSVIIVALGGVLRLSHLQAVGGRYAPHVEHEEGYYESGLSQLSCHVLAILPSRAPSDYIPPTYPSFMALSEAFFTAPSPYHPRAAKTLLSIVATATACLLGWVLFSPLAGLFAGALLAFNPDDILGVTKFSVHGFYGIALLALGVALVLWLERRSVLRTGLLGLMLASTLLCRSAHLPFPLMFAAACLWRWKFPEGRWRALLPAAAASALFLAPMSVRNGLQFGSYSPFDLKGVYILVRSTTGPHLSTNYEQMLDAAESIEPGFRARGLKGRAQQLALLRLSLRRIASAPLAYAWYCFQRFFLYWEGLLFYLALGAFALWRRRGDRPLEALVLTAASLSGYAFAGGAPQYRVSAVPLLCVIAGAGLASLLPEKNAPALPAATRRSLRAGLFILPAAFVVVYAAMLVFLSLELRDHLGPDPNPRVLSDPCPDGRALHALELASMQAGDRGDAAIVYAEQASIAFEYPGGEIRRPESARRLLAVLNGLLRRSPGAAELWLERAEVETRIGEREAALRSLAGAEGLKLLSDEDRSRIAGLYWRLKEHRRALAQIEFLLKRRPEDAQLRLQRVGLEAQLRESRSALTAAKPQPRRPPHHAVMRLPLLKRPSGAWVWLQSAELATRTGARDEALRSLARAEASKPDDDGLRRAASLYRELNEPDRALALLKPLLERRPEDVALRLERAELETLMNDKAAAFESLSRVEALSADGELRRRLALNYQSLGDYGRAIAVLDALIRQTPGEGTFYSDRGLCSYLKGDSSAAIADLEKAIGLKPRHLPAYLSLGSIHRAKGRYAEALKVYDEGLARSSEDDASPLRKVLLDERKATQAGAAP